MKTRLISAGIGLVILGVVFALLDTLVLNVVIYAICVMAVWELLTATGCIKFPPLVALSMLMTLLIPFARSAYFKPVLFEAVYVLILLFFVVMLRLNATMHIEHVAMAFLFSIIVPLFFSCAVYIRDDFGAKFGGFYLLLALGSAWLSDSGAYFVGRKFGKHKLAPEISPKKTVEGAVGGVISCTIAMLILAAIYVLVLEQLDRLDVEVNYLALAICTPIFSVLGMLGDLSASVIKRRFGIKDYGNIMPGHGGVLDRFDSVLFTLPAVYIFIGHVPIITAV